MSNDKAMSTGKMHRELGRVKNVQIGPEDHGIFTFWVHLDFAGSGQAFFGVDDLGKAKGQAVYALRNEPFGTVHALQRIEPDGGAIFHPRAIVEAWEARRATALREALR